MGKFAVMEAMKPETRGDEEDSLYSSDIPSDVIFPDQLVRYYRDQIHSLTLENGGLRRSLEETQRELSSTRERVTRQSQPVPTGRVAEMAEYKIAQLSKRLREQNAEVESLRTQTREAEAKLKRLEEKSSEGERSVGEGMTPSESAEKDRQIKQLTEKLQASNAKVCDFRNQYQSLKQEMKMAQRVIESEIGEKCSIQDLAKENGGWRGRAQQILALQNKVQMLQEQINSSGSENPASNVLRQMEKERRASYEETSRQLNLKTIQMEEMRKKWEAARARNKVLENEIVQVKSRVNALLEKGTRDEHLLSTLTNQINAFEDRGKAQMQCFVKMQENVSKLQQELDFERTKCEQLQKALTDRESRISRMDDQISELRKNLKNKRVESDDENSTESRDQSTLTSPEKTCSSAVVAEAERMRLVELLAVVNKRLDESRQQQNHAESQLRRERYKNAKLETKIARLELEKVGAIKTGRGSYSQRIGDSPTSAADIDILARQHIEYLEEECLALKTRIETLQMEREADLRALYSIAEVTDSGDGRHPGQERNPRKKMNRSHVSSVPYANPRQSSLSSDDYRATDNKTHH